MKGSKSTKDNIYRLYFFFVNVQKDKRIESTKVKLNGRIEQLNA